MLLCARPGGFYLPLFLVLNKLRHAHQWHTFAPRASFGFARFLYCGSALKRLPFYFRLCLPPLGKPRLLPYPPRHSPFTFGYQDLTNKNARSILLPGVILFDTPHQKSTLKGETKSG